jgi:hypothetical protein
VLISIIHEALTIPPGILNRDKWPLEIVEVLMNVYVSCHISALQNRRR